MRLEMTHLEQGVNVFIFINKIVSLYRLHFLTKLLFSVHYVSAPSNCDSFPFMESLWHDRHVLSFTCHLIHTSITLLNHTLVETYRE